MISLPSGGFLASRDPHAAVRVAVRATDPLDHAGLLTQLRESPEIELAEDVEDADVLVVVAEDGLPELPAADRPLVLITDRPRQAELWRAIEHGLAVLLPRPAATPARLRQAITDAHQGRGDLPGEELGGLLRGLVRLHEEILAPRDLALSGLGPREADLLRMLADGLSTVEIATRMAYSERTVKNILQSLLSRLGLRNRTHAVAHALRHGLI